MDFFSLSNIKKTKYISKLDHQNNSFIGGYVPVVLTFIPLQFILGHSICTAIKVFLECVHLPAQDISERLHLGQLLSQAVTLLTKQQI